MQKIFFIIALVLIATVAAAQKTITLQEVSSHTGETVTVCGKIYGGKFLDMANNKPTFLNMGAAYPKQLLTIVIWSNTRNLFTYKPEEYLKGKTVCVTGKIELYKNEPQIVITDPVQLKEK